MCHHRKVCAGCAKRDQTIRALKARIRFLESKSGIRRVANIGDNEIRKLKTAAATASSAPRLKAPVIIDGECSSV